MANYVVTYNISDDDIRGDFEDILEKLELEKQNSNQSTYYGFFNGNLKIILLNEIKILKFGRDDTITIYFPKVTEKKADIGQYEIKEEGKNILNHI